MTCALVVIGNPSEGSFSHAMATAVSEVLGARDCEIRSAVRKGMRRLRELGAKAAIVCTHADNATSVDLYRRLGFTVVDASRGFARPTPRD